MSDEWFDKGREIRTRVMGKSYTDAALASPDPFDQDVQRILTELGYGAVWARPGLPLQTRSLITIALLATLNRPEELRQHIRGALRLGLSKTEVFEALLQVLPYAGAPAMQGGLRVAKAVVAELADKPL
jgi:4-carboxymuconolactone decarboxylase